MWDYKKEFPFSFSDNYCGGILRLICAFYNTYGGIIIFGVHDEKRTFGHNKVKINIEKFNNFIREKLSYPIECQHKTYSIKQLDKNKDVSVLFIPKRQQKIPPVKFVNDVGTYGPNKIYFRQNHEVIVATSENLPQLYSARMSAYEDKSTVKNDGYLEKIESSLPSSPATLRTFVGRTIVLEALWLWLFNSRDARRFLHGDGGSGKTTVAFEFAQLVADNGGGIKNYCGNSFEKIIFLSAKKRELDPVKGKIIDGRREDFSNSEELFQQILLMSGLYDEDDLTNNSEEDFIKKLEELFDAVNILLIIDDIDTLTTRGIDPGAEVLYEIVSRSKSGSKILYTLRNLPSLSMRNAILVPGLDEDTEYPEFISICCKQFKQDLPNQELIDGELKKVSSRRPLVLEVIIGLRRTCGSYRKALDAYEGNAGDEPRSYLFEREYSVLSGNDPKLLLAALALFDKPVSFTEIEVALRWESDKLRNCIGEVNDMFLASSSKMDEDNTLYTINDVAKGYVKRKSERLDLFDTLSNRIQTIKKGQEKKSIIVEKLDIQVRKIINTDPSAAYSLLFSSDYTPDVSERSDFRALRAYVAAKQSPVKLTDMRKELKFATDLGVVKDKFLSECFHREIEAKESIQEAVSICDSVIQGKGYRPHMRAKYSSLKGFALTQLAWQVGDAAPEKALKYMQQATKSNLLSCQISLSSKKADFTVSCERTAKGIYHFYMQANNSDREHVFFDSLVLLMANKEFYWDPLADAFRGLISYIVQASYTPEIDRRTGLLNRLLKKVSNKNINFHDNEKQAGLIEDIKKTVIKLNNSRRNCNEKISAFHV